VKTKDLVDQIQGRRLNVWNLHQQNTSMAGGGVVKPTILALRGASLHVYYLEDLLLNLLLTLTLTLILTWRIS